MAIVDWLKDVATARAARRSLFCLLVSLAAPVFGDSPNLVTLPAGQPVNIEKLAGSVGMYEDRDGTMDVAAVSHDPGFVDGSPAKANIGFSPSAWWVRFTLHNAADSPRLVYLRQGYPLIDSLDLYQPDGSGGWRHVATGDRRPFDSRPVDHRDFLFPLELPGGAEQTIYLRFASQGPIDIHLSLLDANQLAATVSREQTAYGIYFGAVFMLLVWAGLVFIAVRDGAFLAYFVYVATFGLYMSVNTGMAYQYLWPDSPRWANASLLILLSVSLLTALQFSITILRARDYTPRLEKVARALQLLALVCVALNPLLPYSLLVQPVSYLIMVSVVFMIGFGIVSLLAGSRPAKLYVIAWTAFLTGSIVFLLKNFGVLPHTFMTQHSWQVGSLLEMILLSMTLSSRMNELKEQSRTDPLTLLGNRRLFDDKLPAEFDAARQASQPISLLVLDIDNFKTYNDRHGHALGDEAIKLVGGALRRLARKPVLACRFGGDEFCVILPGADGQAASLVAERLRASVQGRGDSLGITISVGFATVTDAGEFATHDKLFEAADAALYSAKQNGRNRVAAYEGGRRTDDFRRPAADITT
jgi:two-component system, sensor histidine kinase LadS